MIRKICLITPSHLASNPRLIKEAIALERAGYLIHIIFTQNLLFLCEADFKILNAHPSWKYDVLNLSKHKFLRYRSALINKWAIFMLNYYATLLTYKLALNKNYYWQKEKAIQSKADLFIAHNLAALPIAFDAAMQTEAKCGFDAEDFHRAENAGNSNQKQTNIAIKIEDYYLPKMDYVTAASPLIAEQYVNFYKREIPVILNVFPRTTKSAANKGNIPLKLFWFSQTIGQNRGLENIMLALKEISCEFEFHLLGNVEQSYKHQLLSVLPLEKSNTIFFHQSIAPDEIFEIATHFDIGIASEPGFSINNNIALSNKIFTYLQTGLAILASDTIAQKTFMTMYEDIGFLYRKGNSSSLAFLINTYHQDRDLLKLHQFNAYKLGQETLNWEIEQTKFIDIISRLNK